jgi:hypothetical protein
LPRFLVQLRKEGLTQTAPLQDRDETKGKRPRPDEAADDESKVTVRKGEGFVFPLFCLFDLFPHKS